MSPYIFRLTLGQIVGQRRTILILLFAAIPILLAVIFRIASTARNDPLEFYAAIFETLIIGLTLPLTALVFGTAALGQDIEDGTATYLLSKPVPRWQIVVEKTAAAWVITTIMLVASVSATGIVLLADEDGQRTIVAFTLAAALGALAYAVCLPERVLQSSAHHRSRLRLHLGGVGYACCRQRPVRQRPRIYPGHSRPALKCPGLLAQSLPWPGRVLCPHGGRYRRVRCICQPSPLFVSGRRPNLDECALRHATREVRIGVRQSPGGRAAPARGQRTKGAQEVYRTC